MKPISLKIKGLNSFIEAQEIDFKRLTDKGLFGIFGPTGSGKSTILDGITLALYGDVARKSSNFMNTNCDSLTVSYEFQITEKEVKRYRVEREYRRDKKSDAVRSKSAKIVFIEGENEIILEEQAKAVTDKCVEIIGLKLEDFTRTVVLPQGNFSEFLKLDGKERRNMLERLFNLQKYGDDLSFKLGRKMKKEREKTINLEGELKAYEDCNKEILKEEKKILKEVKIKQKQSREELKIAEEKFQKGKEIWEFLLELKTAIDKEKKLKIREEEIKGYENALSLGEAALRIEPHIKRYEDTDSELEKCKEKLVNLNIRLKEVTIRREEQTIIYQSAKTRKENELSDLKLKNQQIIEAIKEEELLHGLLKETQLLNERISFLDGEIVSISQVIKDNEEEVEKHNLGINKKEEEIELLKVPEEYKQKINDAVILLKTFDGLEEQKDELHKSIQALMTEVENGKSERDNKFKELEESKTFLNTKQNELEFLEKNTPGNQDNLIEMQNELLRMKDTLDKHKKYQEELRISESTILNLKDELEKKKEQEINLKEKEEALKAQIKKIEQENIARTLRLSLINGEACPVCGSTDHPLHLDKEIESDECNKLKTDHEGLEDKLHLLHTEMTKVLTNLEFLESKKRENEEELTKLGEDITKESLAEFEEELVQKKAKVEEYHSKKIALEKEINDLIQAGNKIEITYASLHTSIYEKEDQLKKEGHNLSILAGKYKEIKEKLEEEKRVLAVTDFLNKRDEISQMEVEKSRIEIELKNLRLRVSQLSKEGTVLSKSLAEFREEGQAKKASYEEKYRQIQEKRNIISKKAGEIKDLEKAKLDISKLIIQIEEDYQEAEKSKNQIEEKYQDCNNQIISLQNNQISLGKRFEMDKKQLENALSQEEFDNISEVKKNYIPKAQIDSMKKEIEEYKDSLKKVEVTIENLRKKLHDRNLTEEEWLAIQKEKEDLAKKLKLCDEEKIKVEESVKNLSEKLQKKEELLVKKSEYDYKLGVLGDLESLFRGKKFVEFVAANQLKYVSLEASKKLKEITGGNYGLEVDENGKFLIRDYKNGGAARDASTLSGGETFLASLSLALSLSAQIQLKGTAPLEFFFLDEGFGTLDDNLLEVVLDSLEKVHHDKLSIGIISHLEAIKNRVPVKLLVTPAEAGMGGSKVKIERS